MIDTAFGLWLNGRHAKIGLKDATREYSLEDLSLFLVCVDAVFRIPRSENGLKCGFEPP